jgi:hypothetical protein
LTQSDSDPKLIVALKRLYREMMLDELQGGSRRLTAETMIQFKEREAA